MRCFSSFTPVATAYNDDFIRIYIKIELVKKISLSRKETTQAASYLQKSLP